MPFICVAAAPLAKVGPRRPFALGIQRMRGSLVILPSIFDFCVGKKQSCDPLENGEMQKNVRVIGFGCASLFSQQHCGIRYTGMRTAVSKDTHNQSTQRKRRIWLVIQTRVDSS